MSASPARLTTVKGLPRKPVRETEQTARPRADNRTGDRQRLAGFPWARRFPSCRPGPAGAPARPGRQGRRPSRAVVPEGQDRALRTGLAK
jgi:hypothetical protein